MLKEKRYKSTKELSGELIVWILISTSISMMFMTSYGLFFTEAGEVEGIKNTLYILFSKF